MGKFHTNSKSGRETVAQIEARFSNNLDFHGQLFGNSSDTVSLEQLQDFMSCWAATFSEEDEEDFVNLVLDCFKLRDYMGIYGDLENGRQNQNSRGQGAENRSQQGNQRNFAHANRSDIFNQDSQFGMRNRVNSGKGRASSNYGAGQGGSRYRGRGEQDTGNRKERKSSYYEEFKQSEGHGQGNTGFNGVSENHTKASRPSRESKWGRHSQNNQNTHYHQNQQNTQNTQNNQYSHNNRSNLNQHNRNRDSHNHQAQDNQRVRRSEKIIEEKRGQSPRPSENNINRSRYANRNARHLSRSPNFNIISNRNEVGKNQAPTRTQESQRSEIRKQFYNEMGRYGDRANRDISRNKRRAGNDQRSYVSRGRSKTPPKNRATSRR